MWQLQKITPALFSWGANAEALFNTTDAITLTNLTVDKAYKATNYNPGSFVGLKGATFTSAPVTDPVPEPTTAPLSLLALAALAARRRRK